MTTRWRVFAGAVTFVLFVVLRVPDWQHPLWAHALVSFAALVLAPLLLDLGEDANDSSRLRRAWVAIRRMQFPSAVLLAGSCCLGPGAPAGLLALPWAGLLGAMAVVGIFRVATRGVRPFPRLCRDAGLIYSAVGAAWLLADRTGLRPLGFDETIVALTAVHFHFAGWMLPVVTGCALEDPRWGRVGRAVGVLVVVGVPCVAAGITLSRFESARFVEPAAALIMAAGGMGVAVVHGILAWCGRDRVLVRSLWGVAAISLAAGMVLAAAYGSRGLVQVWPWLGISWMRAVHGSLNAVGFGWCSVLGWWLDRETAERTAAADS